MIRAEAHSDDFRHAVKFDATPWFEQAEADDIVALAESGWGGDEAAHPIAQFFDGKTGYDGVADMFGYVGRGVGFECNVHQSDAYAWLSQNRPHILREVAAALDEDQDSLLMAGSYGPHWDEDTSWKGDYNVAAAAPQP